MSFSDPVETIDHIPPDFDMKRITPKRPLEQRKKAKARREPPPCENIPTVWKAVAFVGALAIVVGALVQGTWK